MNPCDGESGYFTIPGQPPHQSKRGATLSGPVLTFSEWAVLLITINKNIPAEYLTPLNCIRDAAKKFLAETLA